MKLDHIARVKKNIFILRLFLLLLLNCLISSYSSNKYIKITSVNKENHYHTKVINEVLNIVNQNFHSDEINQEKLTVNLLNQIISDLDQYSEFIHYEDKNDRFAKNNNIIANKNDIPHSTLTNQESVTFFLHKDILYIKIKEFSSETFTDLKKVITNYKKNNNISIIIDLVNNRGGLLDSSKDCLSLFLRKNSKISSLLIKKSKITIRTSKNQFIKNPIYVLVNENSASAAEIFASAIKENKRGLIIGKKTYGKGSVQDLIKLKNLKNVYLKLTVGEHFTSKGEKIQNKGIQPNIKYNFTDKNYELKAIQLVEKIKKDEKK